MTDPFIPGKSPIPEPEEDLRPGRLRYVHAPPPRRNELVRVFLVLVISTLLVAAFTAAVLTYTSNDITGPSNLETEVR